MIEKIHLEGPIDVCKQDESELQSTTFIFNLKRKLTLGNSVLIKTSS